MIQGQVHDSVIVQVDELVKEGLDIHYIAEYEN